VHGRAMIEAELDFSDEAGVPGAVSESIWADMEKLRNEMQRDLQRYHAAEIVRDGFRVVILGAPNAGKSSLLNCLAGRDVAIVTDEPGTTRDVLEVALDLGGIKVVLSDTAGIRAEPGSIEAIGIARAQSAARQADLVLMLQDMQAPVSVAAPPGVEVLKVGTKLDLASSAGFLTSVDLAISSRTGAGIEALLARLAFGAAEKTKPVSESAVPTRQRHIELIAAAIVGLDEALNAERPLELRVEGLRVAGDRIGRLSGEIDPEEVLGEIFSAFCIGK
jgi:tRNA modification GTPase